MRVHIGPLLRVDMGPLVPRAGVHIGCVLRLVNSGKRAWYLGAIDWGTHWSVDALSLLFWAGGEERRRESSLLFWAGQKRREFLLVHLSFFLSFFLSSLLGWRRRERERERALSSLLG